MLSEGSEPSAKEPKSLSEWYETQTGYTLCGKHKRMCDYISWLWRTDAAFVYFPDNEIVLYVENTTVQSIIPCFDVASPYIIHRRPAHKVPVWNHHTVVETDIIVYIIEIPMDSIDTPNFVLKTRNL